MKTCKLLAAGIYKQSRLLWFSCLLISGDTFSEFFGKLKYVETYIIALVAEVQCIVLSEKTTQFVMYQ
jgi:hypothetical protein